MTATAAPARFASALVLIVGVWENILGGRITKEFRLTFEAGPGADARAAAYLQAHPSWYFTAASEEDVTELPVDANRWPLATAILWPECEHGLSASLCVGPSHYPLDM